MFAYHVVTDTPMHRGQQIIFDEKHFSGVYQRVHAREKIVAAIYANPSKYKVNNLDHHTIVALRELAMEEVRKKDFPTYPSRLACLYVSSTLQEAEQWAEFFVKIGRPTYQIVKLKIAGRCFIGDARNCFAGQLDKNVNLQLAERYWKNEPNSTGESPVLEMLVDGHISVVEIIKEINANL